MKKIECSNCHKLNSIKRDYCFVCGKQLKNNEIGNDIDDDTNKVIKEKKLKKIWLIILITLLTISIVTMTIFIIKYNTECKRKEDARELFNYYLNFYTTTKYIKDFSDSVYESWEDYIKNNTYTNINSMFEALKVKESNKLQLINDYMKYTESNYNSLKKDNYYYLNNSEIKEEINKTHEALTEYYNFFFDNDKLSYVSLSLQKDIYYTTTENHMQLGITYILKNTKQ